MLKVGSLIKILNCSLEKREEYGIIQRQHPHNPEKWLYFSLIDKLLYVIYEKDFIESLNGFKTFKYAHWKFVWKQYD